VDFELRHLRYFVTVAEQQNFTRAAERLRIAQPPLSQQIKQLEERIGVRLLVRGKRKTSLTEAGKLFYVRAQRLLDDCRLAVQEAQMAETGECGRLEIGYVAALSTGFLPKALQELRKRHPRLDVRLTDLPEAAQMARLREGSISIAFVSVVPENPAEDLQHKCYARFKLGVLLPKNHGLRGHRIVSLKHLRSDRIISIDRSVSPPAAAFLMQLYSRHGLRTEDLLCAREGQGIIDFVSAGFGVAIVPEFFGERCGKGAIYREIKEHLPEVRFHYLWPKQHGSGALRRFLEVLGGC
jgi:DNA-binding transcriptional LysR family regulator